MTIKNVVIGTGGINVFQLIGAIQTLLNTEYIRRKKYRKYILQFSRFNSWIIIMFKY